MPATVQSRLNDLFATHRHPTEGREFTNKEIADRTAAWAAANDGAGVSASLIQKLRTGGKTNPTATTLWALAKGGFGVRPSYLLGDDEPEEAPAPATPADPEDLQKIINDGPAASLAFRASGLSQESLSTISRMVEIARAAEGLDSGTTG
ncbi:transcriptional regulator [Kitasatospora cineracea]|uniref:transcriptional regulator n=1 Tax=Kitasatospora cineracea TaxID=88074 RepID=UPI0037F88D02